MPNTIMEKKLYNSFLNIAPSIEILQFSQTISSGSGALSMAIRSPLMTKSLFGMHEVHKHCRNFWKIFGLYRKIYLHYCRENTIIAIDAVFYSFGKGLALN